jgi:hypothetical protein
MVTIENALAPAHRIICDALVDTGASLMVLPLAWKGKLGEIQTARRTEVALPNQTSLPVEICGPVKLTIAGFAPIFTEVLFIEMGILNGEYEPLLGYIPLEQCQAAVDMLGHRLCHVKMLDLK